MPTQRIRNHMSLPPPSRERATTSDLLLLDADRAIGWVSHDRVGFRGFADAREAKAAAWVAYRTLSRRLARRQRRRPIPIDVEPLALRRDADHETIFASWRPVGILIRPGPDSRSGPDSFGFEVRIPLPADHETMIGMARLLYRTLRRSGVRWAMWRADARARDAVRGARRTSEHAVAPRPTRSRAPARRDSRATPPSAVSSTGGISRGTATHRGGNRLQRAIARYRALGRAPARARSDADPGAHRPVERRSAILS